ncbi:MAG: sigma-54-dependent Fis family transcriptional regulator [Planctomycetota bacterium]|nr:MAG: sigma-54-dependent Fis family transcriptional regulator [Planctomycetota bacterium]
MVGPTPDILELLLPDAPPPVQDRARRITTFLRLLATDARSTSMVARGDEVVRASEELERETRARTAAAIVALLAHHLGAGLTADTFTWFGEPALRYQDAWDRLAGLRERLPRLAAVPGPGESPVGVARRLLRCGERSGMDSAELALWSARAERVEQGARGGEARFRALLQSGGASFAEGGARRAEAVTEVAACLLDRGAVRAARDWLAEHAPAAGREPRAAELRAARLASWCRLLLFEDGDDGAVSEVGPVPAALRELRDGRPEWVARLAGPAARCRSRPAAGPEVRERGDVGAAVFAVFAFHAGSVAVLLFDAAPGIRTEVGPWLERRDGSWSVSGEPEHRLVLTARTVRSLADDADSPPPRGSLAAGTRALALVPILDDDGEVAGWIHAEWEHALVPGAERLLDIARVWRRAVLDARTQASHDGPAARTGSTSGGFSHHEAERPGDERGPCARVIERLVAGLGLKTTHRRWFAYAFEDERLVRVAEGGEGLPWTGSRGPGGEARALSRARATGGTVTFEESDARLSIHANAASGLVVPLSVGGRPVGLFALESSRRRDFRPTDVERVARAAQQAGLAFRIAQFRTWYRERFGSDVTFDATCPHFGSFARRLLAAARTRTPVVLSGPAGAGKLVVARWLHFESDGRQAELRVERCGAAESVLARRASRPAPATILLDGLERLDATAQDRLLDLLDAASGRRAPRGPGEPGEPDGETPRILATTRRRLAELAETGALGIALARRLERLELFVPPLRDRRNDIPLLARFLARRIAAEEAVPVPLLTDDAQALLWRQAWPGNVRELENAVFKLVLHHAGEELDADAVVRALAPYGVLLARRLPSRHPPRADLVAALVTTRTRGGRPNKSRAAQYLGWDPDTLVARMKDAHLDEEGLDAPNGWGGAVPESEAPEVP